MADVFTERKHKLKMGKVFPFVTKKGRVRKRMPFGALIEVRRVIGYTFSLHATKGWRTESPRRAAARQLMALAAGV